MLTEASVSQRTEASGHAQRLLLRGLRRVAPPVITVLAASFVVYAALSASGNPVALIAGPHPTPRQAAEIRRQLGLDQPLPTRYWHWLWQVLHGNLGTSLYYKTSVASLLAPRTATTALLVLYAGVVVIAIGVTLGAIGAVWKRTSPAVAAFAGFGVAIPSYVAAAWLISLFALKLHWFPALGAGSGMPDRLWHLTLPAVALAIGWSAYVAQITRAALREEITREHAEFARGRGVAPSRVFRRHVARNAAGPILNVSGITVASLLAGTVIIEQAFGINGLGSLLVSSVSNQDDNVVEIITLIILVVFILATTLTDTLHAIFDPRIRQART
jgi:peptide/nickel transport system permease protein